MNALLNYFFSLSNRVRDSFYFLMTLVGLASAFCTVIGVSLVDFQCFNLWIRLGLVIAILIVLYLVIYFLIGKIFSDSVTLKINGTTVNILSGDIFKIPGLKVIGCDSHFDTRVDDNVISKNSLHGKLILEHGNISDIKKAIDNEALRLSKRKNENGLYDFSLGTIICYYNADENENYLMLAMTELDSDYRAYTDMAKFENMLMRMWQEIDRVYAGRPIVLPILGTGISRFKDGFKKPETLLRCLLCTLSGSGVTLKSEVNVVIYDNLKEFSLYEYRYMFKWRQN